MPTSAPTNVYEKRTGRTASSAPTIERKNVNILHHRRIRRWPIVSTAACFAISLRGNCFRWERCHHTGGAVVQICREIFVCWLQCSSAGSFCGLRYNPIRIQRLFLPTFSGKAEKVGLRSNSCGAAAFNGTAVKQERTVYCFKNTINSRMP